MHWTHLSQTFYVAPDAMLNLDHLIADCRAALTGPRPEALIRDLVARAVAEPSGKQLAAADTVRLGESVIHAVTNPLRVFSGAIHVYGGDFFGTPRREWTPDTLEERPFDLARARQVYADANERWRREAEVGT